MMNLLSMALSVIPPVEFKFYKGKGRTLNSIGVWEGKLCDPVDVIGMAQPVPRTLYAQNGLDFQKNYFVFFAEKNVIDIERDVSGDEFYYSGMRFQALSKTDWWHYDGWDQVLAVEVPQK